MLKKRNASKNALTALGVSEGVLKKLRSRAPSVLDSEASALTRAGQERLVQLLKENKPPTEEMNKLRQRPPLKVLP